MVKFKELNIDGMFTDYPDILVKLKKEVSTNEQYRVKE